MIRGIILILAMLNVGWCEFEVIPIVGPLTDRTADRLWPTFSNGAITLNENELIIPDGTHLYLQARRTPFDHTEVELSRKENDSFTIYETSVNKTIFAFTVLAGDGRFYIIKKSRVTGEFLGSAPKHGLVDRMILLPNNKLVASGYYRPRYVTYLDLYDDESQGGQTQKSKDMFLQLYNTDKAFSIAIYDEQLALVDSGNVIDRTGENAQRIERLNLKHPLDISIDGDLYLIDGDDGYLIEKYKNINVFERSMRVKNRNFKSIPKQISKEDLRRMKEHTNSYSVPYALYIKKQYLISSFFQNYFWRDGVQPPYYYDISTMEDGVVASGELCYPILCEDEGDKVFLFVTVEEGWFESDSMYLVGVTINDLLNGKVSQKNVDESVAIFRQKVN